jgi:hypothetical protein
LLFELSFDFLSGLVDKVLPIISLSELNLLPSFSEYCY